MQKSRFLKLGRKSGQPPGTLSYTGEITTGKPVFRLVQYSPEFCEDFEQLPVMQLLEKTDINVINWINLSNLQNPELVEKIGNRFDLHPLLLEDILNTEQQPKVEEFRNCLFLIMKMLRYQSVSHELTMKHVGLVLGDHFVISFQEELQDVFEPIRERIIRGHGRMRSRKADYLFYLLVDRIVDEYLVILDELSNQVNSLEFLLQKNPKEERTEDIFSLKKIILTMNKLVAPLQNEMCRVQTAEFELIEERNYAHFNDLKDHLSHANAVIQHFLELNTGLMDLQRTNQANKMNNIMMTLTVIATIFIPLTFIAGIYGMNFANMPELEWRYGYPAVLILMVVIAVIMLVYMKIKKWL